MVAELSLQANEELLLFFFQLDLSTRLQRALNQDQFEPAQQLREKIAQVEREIARQRDAKMGASLREEAQDKTLTFLRIKGELLRAVEEEDYVLAAKMKKKLNQLERDALAASAAALAVGSVKYSFRLGQKVWNKEFGYRGVIAGMDSVCCESEDWKRQYDLQSLSRGPNQPFYQVLHDVQEHPGYMVAYVAEEFLELPAEPDKEEFSHPYMYLLFYGVDANGDFIPCKQLREKYNAPRHEVPLDDDESEEGS